MIISKERIKREYDAIRPHESVKDAITWTAAKLNINEQQVIDVVYEFGRSMSKNDGGAAFPSRGSMGEIVQEGMSLREYFAARAPDVLSFYLPSSIQTKTNKELADRFFSWKWFYADMIIKEGEK